MAKSSTVRFLAVSVMAASMPLFGSVLYETATNGGSNAGSIDVSWVQFVGSTFTLGSPANITDVIGEIEEPALFFMAIMQLSGSGALPNNLSGSPFAGVNVLFTTTFTGGDCSGACVGDVLIPVSLSVPAGTFAVVFGTGLFGSPVIGPGGVIAGGGMPDGLGSGNVVQPGADLIVWYDSTEAGGAISRRPLGLSAVTGVSVSS
jgi:hypothetical protein